MKLQQSILSKVQQNKVIVSVFAKGTDNNLQVLLYKNGKTYQLYEGTNEVDFDNLTVNCLCL